MGVLEIFDGCSLDVWRVSWRYLVSLLEIFIGCPINIWSVS